MRLSGSDVFHSGSEIGLCWLFSSVMCVRPRFKRLGPSAQHALVKQIGEILRSEYSAVDARMPERLSKLLDQLERELSPENQAAQKQKK